MTTRTDTAEHRLLPMIFGAVQGQLLRVAVQLRIPEQLQAGPRTLDALVAATGADAAALRRLLRALDALGVISDAGADGYRGTALSALLCADSATSNNHYARMNNSTWLLNVLTGLDSSVRSGTPASSRVLGTEVYEYLQQHPADGAEFNAALTELSAQDAQALLGAYDFGRHALVVDVGGGEGALLGALLDAHPRLQGILLDFGEVVARAPGLLGTQVGAGRCRIAAGDFRDGVPAGADLYVLKRVVSTCSAADMRAGLARIRAVIATDGRVLIADPDPQSLYGALLDVLMLVATGGGLRTQAELGGLLQETGFRIARAFDAGAILRVYEAVAV